MSRALRILNVEDSQDDSLLLMRHLQSAGYQLTCRRVDCLRDMAEALDTQCWDIILADYSLPRFSALQALSEMKARQLDLPFLIVSGVIGEETAVAAMRAGAHDYLMKDRLARLVPAIERELQEAANRRDRRRVEMRQAVLNALTTILAESESFADARPKILQTLCEGLNWDLGTFWEVDSGAAMLHCRETWHRQAADAQAYLLERRMLSFRTGEGLPGRVWARGGSLWITDIQKDPAFIQHPRIPGLIRSGLAFPVRNGDEFCGVIECFCSEAREPENELLRMFETFSSQLGQFMARRRAEDALRESEALLAGQNRILEMVATEADLGGILEQVVHFVEEQVGYGVCSIAMVNRTGTLIHLSASTKLPEALRAALLQTSMEFTSQAHRELVHAHRLNPVFTKPILSSTGERLGVLTLYFREDSEPGPEHVRVVEIGTNLAALAIQHKRIEASRELKLQSLLQNMAEGVIAVDGEGRLIVMNPEAQRLLGLTEVTEGITVQETVLPGTLAEALYFMADPTAVGPETAQFAAGDLVIEAYISPVKTGFGHSFGALALLKDVTSQAKLRLLEESLVANVSHELRAPLASATAMVEALIDGLAQEETRKKYLQFVLAELLRLRRLTNDLLELSRLDAGVTAMEWSRFNAAELCQNLAEKWQARCANAGLELQVCCSDLHVLSDYVRVEQILTNFLDNAVRFTPKGGRITMFAIEEEGQVRLGVSDTGPGIPEEHVPHVWRRFYMADAARVRTPDSGTGLGLAISKQMVERLGGRVALKSRVGEGSTFSFTLPVALQRAASN